MNSQSSTNEAAGCAVLLIMLGAIAWTITGETTWALAGLIVALLPLLASEVIDT